MNYVIPSYNLAGIWVNIAKMTIKKRRETRDKLETVLRGDGT